MGQCSDAGFLESRFTTNSRLRSRAGDACASRRKASGVIRLTFLGSLGVAALTGCKEPAAGASPAVGLVTAGQAIAVASVRTYPTSDAVAGSSDEYYIVTFTFTNTLGSAFAPRIDHFILEDDQKRRFLGADSGNANLVGLRNDAGMLKAGDAHEYTVGFRVPQNTRAKLFYDATF